MLLRNPFFGAGLAFLAALGLVGYFLVDNVIMPRYTRHDTQLTVPDVMNLPPDEATQNLIAAGLRVEEEVLRKPKLPRNVVIDQRPQAGSFVKPGRRVWITVNTGDTTTVVVPKLIGLPTRQAQSDLLVLGLTDVVVEPDSIPSPHDGAVTMQQPRAGSRVPAGTPIQLKYGTGLGSAIVSVPDITGLSASDARSRLLSVRLRSVLLGNNSGSSNPTILDQSPVPGTQVREGFEVRLRASRPSDNP